MSDTLSIKLLHIPNGEERKWEQSMTGDHHGNMAYTYIIEHFFLHFFFALLYAKRSRFCSSNFRMLQHFVSLWICLVNHMSDSLCVHVFVLLFFAQLTPFCNTHAHSFFSRGLCPHSIKIRRKIEKKYTCFFGKFDVKYTTAVNTSTQIFSTVFFLSPN